MKTKLERVKSVKFQKTLTLTQLMKDYFSFILKIYSKCLPSRYPGITSFEYILVS